MNNIYIYNDNFISLLNLIDILINNNIKPYNIKNNLYNPTLFDNLIKLEIIENNNIIDKVIENTSLNIFNIIYKVFLSDNINKEIIIFYFYLNSLKYKDKIIYNYKLKCVVEALRINKYVGRENHKFKGFTRFKELENNILYAEINPTNNILFLLSRHFKERLRNEYWIIKDVNRNLYSIYNKKDFIIVNDNEFSLNNLNISNKESCFKDLWISFYNTIGIESRKNDLCRMNFMPKKHWKYIIEMSEEYEKNS